MLALKPRKGTWAPADQAHTPTQAAGELGWHGPGKPGQWRHIQRRFRDGHPQTWWAADTQLAGWGPDRRLRLVVATTDSARLRPGTAPGCLLASELLGRKKRNMSAWLERWLPRESADRGLQARNGRAEPPQAIARA